MTDHTPEPWGPLPDEKVKVFLTRADWGRARACVNACAGIPTENLGDVRALVQAAQLLAGWSDVIEPRTLDWPATTYKPWRQSVAGVRAALATFRKD